MRQRRGQRPAPSSVEAEIARALGLARAGSTAGAEAALRKVVAAAPRHPHALHFLGMMLHQRGATDEAIEHLERAVAAAPGDHDLRNNLANLHILAGRLTEAEEGLRALVARAPTLTSARFNLGVLLSRTRRWPEAIAELTAAAALARDVDTFRELGAAHRAVGHTSSAVTSYRAALAIQPGDPDLTRILRDVYAQLVDELYRKRAAPEAALAVLRDWLELAPDDPLARHALAAHGAERAPERCSDAYVKATFDGFAQDFDEVLANVGYCGVDRTSAAILEARVDASAPIQVLADVGCGTGALGPLLRDRCTTLLGVDLSPRMLDLARARGVYDELVEAELVAWLTARPCSIDVIACADTLNYFGDLSGALGAMAAALREGGHVVFTVEEAPTDAEGDSVLGRHGRYAHRQASVGRLVGEAGMDVLSVERLPALRREQGQGVPALVVTTGLRPT